MQLPLLAYSYQVVFRHPLGRENPANHFLAFFCRNIDGEGLHQLVDVVEIPGAGPRGMTTDHFFVLGQLLADGPQLFKHDELRGVQVIGIAVKRLLDFWLAVLCRLPLKAGQSKLESGCLFGFEGR